MKKLFFLLLALPLVFGCSKNEDDTKVTADEASLNIKFNFDENQARLNNIGQPSNLPSTNAAQTPDFHGMSVHLIELVPSSSTIVGNGVTIYKGAEITIDGEKAIDFDEAIVAPEDLIFKTVKLKDIPAGTYEYIRVSVAYQNYDIRFNLLNLPILGDLVGEKGRVASFLGFNNYIRTVKVKDMELAVNAAHLQGFWAFETQLSSPFESYNQIFSGAAPEGSTTVVNPLAGISDIPPGSCIVTGKFANPLVIPTQATEDVELTLSFSINNSLEWVDLNSNGQLDFDAETPTNNEQIVDMGLRGLIPSWK